MPPVFARSVPNPHPYEQALATWLLSTDASHRAMARNIMHDPRVSSEREKSFDQFVDRPVTCESLQRALVEYHKARVQTRQVPEYMYIFSRFNSGNLLCGTWSGPHRIKRDQYLVRVLDLNGLGGVLQWAKTAAMPEFAMCPGRGDDKPMADWLDLELLGKPESAQRAFVTAILVAMSRFRLVKRYEPAWATAWDRFERFAAEKPERWAQVAGVPKTAYPRWLVLLSYNIREAGTVVAPTQLDTGWNAYHFPSPLPASSGHPTPPPATGGHPMDLRDSPRATELLPEFVHCQIAHAPNHIQRIGRTDAAVSGPFAAQRRNHHDLLVLKYGPDVRAWMPDGL